MKNRLTALFDLRDDELKIVLLVLLQSFVIGIPRLFTFTAGSSLFLKDFSAAYLPYTYIASSVVIPLSGFAYLRLGKYISHARLLTTVPAIFCLVLLGFRVLLYLTDAAWPAAGLIIWNNVEWTLTNLVFWGAAGRLFTVRQSKRVFGLIGTGEVAATILGGLLLPYILKFMSTADLLYFSMGGFALTAALMMHIIRLQPESFEEGREAVGDESEPEENEKQGLREHFRNPYLLLIFAIISASYFAYYFLDNAFFQQVQARYPDSKDMAAFLGIFFAVFGVLNFLFKAFVSGRWLNFLGLRGSLISTPVILLVLSIAVVTAGVPATPLVVVFWLVVVVRMAEKVFADSVHRPAYYTLYQTLPAASRNSAQASAETVVAQIAGGAAGLLLLYLNRVLGFQAIGLTGVLLGVLLFWCLVSFLAGNHYNRTLADALKTRGLRGADLPAADSRTVSILEDGLKSERPGSVLHCLHLLEEMGHPRLKAMLFELTSHGDPRVRERAYRDLEELAGPEDLERLRELSRAEANPRVRGAVLPVIAAAEPGEAFDVLLERLRDEAPETRLGALLGLLRHCGLEGAVDAGHELLRMRTSADANDRRNAARLLGDVGVSGFYRGLLPLMRDEDREVRRAALKSAAVLRAPKLWSSVLELLGDSAVRREAFLALEAGGRDVVPLLAERLNDRELGFRERKQASDLLGRIPRATSLEALKSAARPDEPDRNLLQTVLRELARRGYRARRTKNRVEEMIAREADYAALVLASLKDLGDYEPAELLRNSLEYELEQIRDRLFSLYSFLYAPAEILRVRDNFAHESSERRAFALELLETLTSRKHKAILLPLLEDLTPEKRHERLAGDSELFGRVERIRRIALKKDIWDDPWVRSCAVYALEDPAKILDAPEAYDDELVRETATFVLNQDSDQVPVLEKVRILNRSRWFGGIPDEVLAATARQMTRVSVGAGEDVFRRGDPGDSMYIIASGRLRIHDQGRTLVEMAPGGIFGEMAALSSQARDADVSALEDSVLLRLSREELYEWIGERTEAARGIIGTLCRNLSLALQRDVPNHSAAEAPARELPPDVSSEGERGADYFPGNIEKILALKSIPMFAETPDGILLELVEAAREIRPGAGGTLYQAGSSGNAMYVLLRGVLRLEYPSGQVDRRRPTSIVGEMSAFAAMPRSATVTAESDALLLRLEREMLFELMRDRLEFTHGVIGDLIRRLRDAD